MTNLLTELKLKTHVHSCVCCKEEITSNNVFTASGWREVEISGMCEVCFDNCTYSVEDKMYVINTMNRDVTSLIKNNESVVLAGGALRTLVDPTDEICDYDIFLLDQTKLESVKTYFENLKYNKIFECPQGKLTTYKLNDDKVQIINKRSYKDCNELIGSFDITACCAAWDGENFYKHRRFISDVLNKKINLNTVEYPKATLNRIVKYGAKGYKLSRQANEYFLDLISDFTWADDNSEFYID